MMEEEDIIDGAEEELDEEEDDDYDGEKGKKPALLTAARKYGALLSLATAYSALPPVMIDPLLLPAAEIATPIEKIAGKRKECSPPITCPT